MPPTEGGGTQAGGARSAAIGPPPPLAPVGSGGASPPAARRARSGPTRATPVALLAVAGALLAARIGFGIYEHARPVERADRVEWREPAAGEAEARASRRPALYYFTHDGEPRGRQMSREVFGDPRTAAAIQLHFVPIRVLDLSRDEGKNPPDVARLEQEYAVKEFPTLVVAYPDRPPIRQVGYPGARATQQFLTRATARTLVPAPRGRPRTGQDSAAAAPDAGANGPAGR